MPRSHYPNPETAQALNAKVEATRLAVVSEVDRRRQDKLMRRALELISAGRELDGGDGTTVVTDREDAMEIARAALEGRPLPA